MDILPVLKAFAHNKTGALLIIMQFAITLAVICNCLCIVQDNFRMMGRPSGVDESNIFIVGNQWTGKPSDLAPRIRADLAAIRALPSVMDAQATDAYPLRGGGLSRGISTAPDQKFPTASTAMYFVDERGLNTYGLRLTAGRWFTAGEIGEHGARDAQLPRSVIISAALAHALYPSGNALGQQIYWSSASASSRIVGIVERAQAPWAAWSEGGRAENSAFLPYLYINNPLNYVVRAQPGQLATAIPAVQERLYSLTRQRSTGGGTFAENRATNYFAARSTGTLLEVLCAVLLIVTVFGIIGLTMHWVGQRRRHIGLRRALGARRADILRYFHTENLLISGIGAALGVGLALAANLWLVSHLAIPRLGIGYALIGAAVVMVVSQAAVSWPALRAASVPPAIATRGL